MFTTYKSTNTILYNLCYMQVYIVKVIITNTMTLEKVFAIAGIRSNGTHF